MSISQNDTTYSSNSKADWRKWIYSLLTPSRTRLVDDTGRVKYRWLEPVGENAGTFKQLIDSNKITEDKLIGIDLDPNHTERSIDNIGNCRKLFPQAEFHAIEWMDFCAGYESNDIGVFIFDFYTSTYGEAFEMMLKAVMGLLEDCKRYLGEVLIVINGDMGIAKRIQGTGPDNFAYQIEKIFKTSDLIEFNAIDINSGTCYTYQQTETSTQMASFAIFL